MPTKKRKPLPKKRKSAPKNKAAKKAAKPRERHEPFGRPTQFKPDYVEMARKLCELGATDVELADFFKVSERTLNTWKVKHADFLQSLTLGKAAPDNRVEASLYRRALGYTHESEQILVVKGQVKRLRTVKQYPPDAASCIFWLKNRRRSEWTDVMHKVLTNPPGQPLEIATYVATGPELLENYYARLAVAAAAAPRADPAAAHHMGRGGFTGEEPDGDQDAVPDGPLLSPR